MAMIGSFHASTRIRFGPGTLTEAGAIVQNLGVGKALIVTDQGVAEAGIAGRVVDELTRAGIGHVLFAAVEANPGIVTVDKAITLYRETHCEGIVAVGGGSSIDVAKAVGLLAANPGVLWDYVGIGKVGNPLPPLVAVPTTVGTGSEVTTFAVLTDRAQRKKVVIGSPLIAPNQAVLDPELALTLPADLVAHTGMDALTHAIESVLSNFASPFSDALALEAVRLIAANLPGGTTSPDLERRARLLYASTIAGLAFSCARTGLVHGMAHPLSSYYDIQHGLANAILLPTILSFNAPECKDRLARVGAAMGEAADPQAAIAAVVRLAAEVGIPTSLRKAGVTEKFIPEMAKDAFESGNAQVVNPRKPTLSDVMELYRQAL